MRFLVDLYRYIIFLFCAFALIGAALIALSAADHSTALGAALTGWMLFAVIAALVVMVLGLGGTAILVSIHDRHVELVEEAERIATAVEQLAANLTKPAEGRA
jgi:sensor histidine kinase regulating citrate/malate metabolism